MDEFEKFFNYSLKFLSYRQRSEKEVRDALKSRGARSGSARKNISPETIERIINKLKELKFLDDTEFAKLWVEQRIEFKPRSFSVIKMELRQKGIAAPIIEEVLSSREEEELEVAKALVKKQERKMERFDLETKKKKLFLLLQRRGFSWDITRKAVDDILTKGV